MSGLPRINNERLAWVIGKMPSVGAEIELREAMLWHCALDLRDLRATEARLRKALEGITVRDGVERRHEICFYHDHLEHCDICEALGAAGAWSDHESYRRDPSIRGDRPKPEEAEIGRTVARPAKRAHMKCGCSITVCNQHDAQGVSFGVPCAATLLTLEGMKEKA